jgi:hypothetical protein
MRDKHPYGGKIRPHRSGRIRQAFAMIPAQVALRGLQVSL